MQSQIQYGPAFALGILRLDAGEEIKAESGAMVSMSPNVSIETKAQGGILGGLKRSVLGGESFFINTFRANGGPAELTVAPVLPGDIVHLQLNGETMFVQSGSYIASSPGIDVDTKWGGAKTFFSSEGLFLLRCSGAGDLFLSSYGAIREVDLGAGETLKLDTGHMVAFAEGMQYSVEKVGGWKSTLLSGEGLVASVTGPGRLYTQTRTPSGFLAWLIPQLPTSSSS
jgi:uncharacterized protein (TIGR00266 family)